MWIDAESNRLCVLKLFSTLGDPSVAIAEAVGKIVGEPMAEAQSLEPLNAALKRRSPTEKQKQNQKQRQIETPRDRNLLLMHGTTVGTNALLQRKGGRVAFVTTAGFEDSIEIGRQARPKLYDFFFDAVEPLVMRELRFGVSERIDKDGKVLRSPSDEDISRLVEAVATARPDAIAVSLLFSFANPENETRVAAELEKLGVPVSVSHEILPEFREYERASTVVVNAYLQPVMAKYLNNVSRRLGGSRVFVMQSSGGLTSLETATREPVRTVLSGPAGGVVGAAAMAARSGYDKIIGFDMGGTSTDVCLVEGTPTTTNEAEVAGLPVRVPMLNIHTVGAGGGSIARFDAGGSLHVGPESAGAEPGPICYGRGTSPTVTDANLLLGRLPAKRFLGGEFELDVERTRRVMGEWLRKSGSKLSLMQFAEGIIRVVNANMEKAVRVVSIEKGFDTRDFSLVAFGGAGAMHGCELAESLEIPRVIVPAMPGALSAVGILMSDIVKDYSRTVMLTAEKAMPLAKLEAEFRELKQRALRDFEAERWKGEVQFESRLEVRYKGQGFEISIRDGARALAEFHCEHKRRYGYERVGSPVEIVTVRLRAWIKTDPPKLAAVGRRSLGSVAELAQVTFAGKARKTQVVERGDLSLTKKYAGAAIVTEYSGTTVVPPGWSYSEDKAGNLILEQMEKKKKKATG
ncbi:MAG: 5-oxoprolinase (ATP-hydrolyzing) [Acidobacteriales bacterium]|nr:5-oxoprolinase (ATP-hydrolyzing) [Terriglobales bacterium]